MAYQVSGQAPAPGSEGRRLKEVERAIAQLQRLMTAKQKIPKAAVASGGGPIGVVEIASVGGTVNVSTGPGSGLNRDDVRYEAPTVPFGFDGTTDWVGFAANPSIITLTPGWYSVIVELAIVWGTAAHSPAYFKPVIYNGAPGHDWDKMWVPATTDAAGLRGLHHFLDIGPQYVADASTVLQAQCAFNASPGSASLFEGRVTWKIAKW